MTAKWFLQQSHEILWVEGVTGIKLVENTKLFIVLCLSLHSLYKLSSLWAPSV